MKTTIIAEIGLNHNGNMEMAKCLIDEAHRAGADIAKFQFFDISEYFGPEFEWYEECMKARIDYDKAEMLRDYCDKVGIEFMSSVFNLQGVEWAEKLGMKRYKIASRCIGQQDLFEVHIIDSTMINNGAIQVIKRKVREQKGKVCYNGVVMTNWIDVHTIEDVNKIGEL